MTDDASPDREPGWQYLLFADLLEEGVERVVFAGAPVPEPITTPEQLAPIVVTMLETYLEISAELKQLLEQLRPLPQALAAADEPTICEIAGAVVAVFGRLVVWNQLLFQTEGSELVEDVCTDLSGLALPGITAIDLFAAGAIGSLRDAVAAAVAGRPVNGVNLSFNIVYGDDATESLARVADRVIGALIDDELISQLRLVTGELAAGLGPATGVAGELAGPDQ